jgi:hypothetical protein
MGLQFCGCGDFESLISSEQKESDGRGEQSAADFARRRSSKIEICCHRTEDLELTVAKMAK